MQDINGKRNVRKALSDRAIQYPAAGAVISTSADVGADDQTAAQDAFDPISVLLVKDGSVTPIGGLLTPSELDTSINEFNDALTVGGSIAKSDMLGTAEGAMVSESKDRGKWETRLEIINITFTPCIMQTFKKLGIPFNGWAETSEMNKVEKIAAFSILTSAFNNARDEGLKKIAANILMNVFKEESNGVTIDTTVEEPIQVDTNGKPTDTNGSSKANTNGSSEGNKKRKWFGRG